MLPPGGARLVAMAKQFPFYVAGRAENGSEQLDVLNPYDGTVAGSFSVPDEAQVERAVQAAADVTARSRALPAATRAAALDHISRKLADRVDEIAELITAENGKPVMWARAEANRAVSTFRWAAEEARRFSGDLQRLDTDAAAEGRMAVVRRFAKGPVLGISPFNFPLNLAAHKVAPAIACGAPIVLKPALKTPLSALLLGEILAETDLPEGTWSILPVHDSRSAELVKDPRLPVISFTGSETVGFTIAAEVPTKQVILELGGNAAAVVMPDWQAEGDLDWAAARIATFGNYQAGQSCISVQRVLVHEDRYREFTEILTAKLADLATGDPKDPETVVGPLINAAAAERVESWVAEAVDAGATLLVGGKRNGTEYAPTLLADVPSDAKVCSEEVFGPVMVVSSFGDVNEAFATVNDSRFGLQAGVFTHNVQIAFRAQAELEVGGIVIGDVPSYRADQMPYGGVKNSGSGREGIASAIEDYTDVRVMVLTGLDL